MDIEKLRRIKVIALDIDGVMTDGGLLAIPGGEVLRSFNAKDTFAVRAAGVLGMTVAVFTGGWDESVHRRLLNLGVKEENIHMSCRGKINNFNKFCSEHGFDPSEVLYIGDDIPDVQVLKACGMGVVPADAWTEAKESADYISPFGGGRGCVRDAIEQVMKAQGKWNFGPDNYDRIF